MAYKPYTLRFAKYFLKYKLTPAGRFLFFGICCSGLGLISVLIPLYQIFCGLCALFAVTWMLGLVLRPRLLVEGDFPSKLSAGHEVTFVLTITNRSRLPAMNIMAWCVELPESWKLLHANRSIHYLPAGESAKLPVTLRPLRRGLYDLPDLILHTTFPFNLLRSGSCRHPLGVPVVLPTFHPLLSISVPLSSRYQPGGIALTSNIGESPEYIGNREYVPGLSTRRLDFRSWARLAKPVVKEYQEEYYCRVALILDTFVPSGVKLPPAGFPEMEAAVSLTASIADALSDGEYLIDLFAAGPELYVFRLGRHTGHFENVLEILSCVEACRSNPFDQITPAIVDELSSISTAICIFLDWDISRQTLARTVLESGCRLKVFIVRDGKTTTPIDGIQLSELTQLETQTICEGGFQSL